MVWHKVQTRTTYCYVTSGLERTVSVLSANKEGDHPHGRAELTPCNIRV